MALLALGVLVLVPRAIVAGVDDQRVVRQLQFIECIQQPAGFVVKLLHHVAIQPSLRFAAKLRRGVDDRVHHRMRQVQHERLLGVALVPQIFNRLVRVELREPAHVLGAAGGLVVFMKPNRAVIVRPERTEIIIEPLSIRHAGEDRLAVGHVPLADAGRLVARLANQLRPGDLTRRHPPAATADRLPPREQRRARRPADGL